MAAEPSAQSGQLSPDGKLRWNGAQWVPVSPAPRGSNACIWWLAGGCALVVVLVIAGVALAGSALTYRFQHGGFSCLPSDFPTYPGSTLGGETYDLNAPTPGNSCHMVFESKDGVATVMDFYASRLDAGDWHVTSSSQTSGQIAFRKVKNVKKMSTNGTVDVAVRGSGTEITVQLYSRNL
jgi:hypothetical protein